VRAVLLDALGTLLRLRDPAPALATALREEHGIEVEAAQAAQAFGAEIAYYRSHHHEARDEAALLELRRRCAEVLHAALPATARLALSLEEIQPLMLGALRFEPYPEVPGVLRALRDRGLRLVVASNWDISLHEVLSATGLSELLDGALASAEVGVPKPAPEIFMAALALAGVAPEAALHVGDSPEHDIPGALAAGIAPVLICRGAGLDGGASRSHGVPVLSSLEELPALLG
jgi:putative hydrolase of the HAD superfamily